MNLKVYAEEKRGEGKDSVVLIWLERRRGQVGYVLEQVG